jgi:parallel beta-helix repeat protein
VADYCCRIYRAPRSANGYHNGADAAALVLMCNSSRNTVRGNFLRGGGDGVFLGGFHKDQILVPCNDNIFEKNDGSDSPNIAFEATFSERNVFRDNKADNCNYGFWLGWSSENTVAANQIRNSRVAGVAIEHGRANRIEDNRFERNRTGVQLWVNSDEARGAGMFRAFFPKNSDSHATFLTGNTIQRSDTGVHCWTQREEEPVLRCHDFVLENNTIEDNRIAVQFERVRDSPIVQNRITGNVEAGIKLIGCANVFVERNVME